VDRHISEPMDWLDFTGAVLKVVTWPAVVIRGAALAIGELQVLAREVGQR